MKIEGKCALVTGSANGIGRELARRLLSKGAKFVAIVDIDEVAGQATAVEFGEEFGEERVRFISCDVSINEQLEAAFEEAFSIHGCLDVVVNNAGIVESPRILQINLGGVIRGTYLAKKYMNREDGKPGGVVINTSSMAGFAALIKPEYTATKYGILGFTLAMAVCDSAFISGDNIRIVTICPSAVDTTLVDNSAEMRARKAKANLISVDQAVDGFVLGIEDDTKHGCCIRITPGNGIDLLPVKSGKEWQEELKTMKT